MLRDLQNIILLRDWRKPTSRAEWSVGILGGVIALIGIILALGGAKLIGVGGSWYYLLSSPAHVRLPCHSRISLGPVTRPLLTLNGPQIPLRDADLR
jgi:hypothetical protein